LEVDYGHPFNSLGHRSRELNDIPKNAFKILVLGGSTTNMWPYVKNNNKIWTKLLEDKLSEKYSMNIDVINAGLPYGTSAELMVHFLMVEKYLKPNLVIYHDSGNDIMPLMFPDYKTDYSYVRWSASGLALRSHFKWALQKSSLLKLVFSVIFRGDIDVNNGNPPWSILRPQDTIDRVIKTYPTAFESNVNVITAESIRSGAKVLLVGFLQARKENISKNKPEFIGFEDSFIAGQNKLDETLAKIAMRTKSTYFMKLNLNKFADEWFQDNCHLTENGEEEKSQQIYEKIVALKLIK
jgi:hypothetical protein